METAPSQDSPKHILNILNDDCIQAIFRQIKYLRDFLSAAETCKRFQRNAKKCFRPKFGYGNIRFLGNPSESQTVESENYYISTIPFDRMKNLLNIFGHLITCIRLSGLHHDEKSKEEILKMIAHFCGKTLQRLKLFAFDCEFNSLSPLSALQILELQFCTLWSNVEVHSNITTLCLQGPVIKYKKGRPLTDWIVKKFPHLEVAKFQSINIKRNMLNQFLTLNPQLKTLHIFHGRNLTSSILRDIGHRVPNLEQFGIGICGNRRADNIQTMNANMIHISGMRKLKTLYIHHVKVEIHCLEYTTDVPSHILEANRTWIDIFKDFGNIFDKQNLTFRFE